MCPPLQITDKKLAKERAADAARIQQLEKQVLCVCCSYIYNLHWLWKGSRPQCPGWYVLSGAIRKHLVLFALQFKHIQLIGEYTHSLVCTCMHTHPHAHTYILTCMHTHKKMSINMFICQLIKAMETSIRWRYPDSITSLIYASKSSEDDSSSNYITYLNNWM